MKNGEEYFVGVATDYAGLYPDAPNIQKLEYTVDTASKNPKRSPAAWGGSLATRRRDISGQSPMAEMHARPGEAIPTIVAEVSPNSEKSPRMFLKRERSD